MWKGNRKYGSSFDRSNFLRDHIFSKYPKCGILMKNYLVCWRPILLHDKTPNGIFAWCCDLHLSLFSVRSPSSTPSCIRYYSSDQDAVWHAELCMATLQSSPSFITQLIWEGPHEGAKYPGGFLSSLYAFIIRIVLFPQTHLAALGLLREQIFKRRVCTSTPASLWFCCYEFIILEDKNWVKLSQR